MSVPANDRLKLVEGYPKAEIEALSLLFKRINNGDFAILDQQLQEKSRIHSCFAYDGSHMIGYKIGFEQRPRYFESWIGGVDPAHRRNGIARAMMTAQHEWCRQAGFRIITTTCAGDNQPMLIANLKSGFEVSGTFLDRRITLKVILQKMIE